MLMLFWFFMLMRISPENAVVRRRDHQLPVRDPSRQVILGPKRDSAQGTCHAESAAVVAPLYEAARSEAVATSKLHSRCRFGSSSIISRYAVRLRSMIVEANGAEHSVFSWCHLWIDCLETGAYLLRNFGLKGFNFIIIII